MASNEECNPPGVGPLLSNRPWVIVGLPRSNWYELKAAGRTPAPVNLPGRRVLYRVADLRQWVDKLGSGRHKGVPLRAA